MLLPRLDRLLAALPEQPVWQWLGRADRIEAAPATVPHAVFDVVPVQFAHAAVARQGEVGDASLNVWLRADPCWLQPDMSTLRMMACGQLQLTQSEAEDLAASVRAVFGDAGMELSIPHPDRWYLKLPMGSDPPPFSPPADVLGDDIERHLPSGNSGLRWKRLLNEVQMSLHLHPVSKRREAKGMTPVNSLWFWGGGRLPNRVRPARARYFTEDQMLRGLANLAGVVCLPVAASLAAIDNCSDSMIDLRGVDPQPLIADWLDPLIRRLRAKQMQDITFGFSAGERFELRSAHRWRFWRKPLSASGAGD